MSINRILFTGDFMRPVDDPAVESHGRPRRFRPSQTDNILWLYFLLRRKLADATKLPVDVLCWNHGINAPYLFDVLGVERSVTGWAEAFASEEFPPYYIELIESMFRDSLVVSFELMDSVAAVLTHLGIPYIDLAVHPIRFMPDVFFALSTNDPTIFDALKPRHTSEADYYNAADILLASALKMNKPSLPAQSTLLIGQTEVDRSVIVDGKLCNFSDYKQKLSMTIDFTKPIVVKAHPYSTQGFGIYESGIPFASLRKTTDNIYLLLASPDVEKVVGVSSSVLFEAPYFDKPTVALASLPFDIPTQGGVAKPGQHISVFEGFMDADFWRDLLSGILPTTTTDGRRFTRPPHMLRTSLRNFWGFNEVSTDFVTSLYKR